MAKRSTKKTSYGIAELYGESFVNITQRRRVELLDASPPLQCPHLASFPTLAPLKKGAPAFQCNKKGGVCSIRNFTDTEKGQEFGPITTTCPIRFYENGTIFKEISKALLKTDNINIAKEIPFLMRPDSKESTGIETGSEDVGRIDMVLADSNSKTFNWCAVELQAVYFSGGAMAKDYPVIRSHSGNTVPMPGANRRPDFRSSGPKRLMPQLQIKVPTLRRWGKKMAVVVDRPFFDSLGEMDHVADVSNCDIAWCIVSYDEQLGSNSPSLKVDEIRLTTLERAVEGLTAGHPTTLSDFENKIRAKIQF